MKINRKLLYDLYMKEVETITEVCDWKTNFSPEEIVDIIATILEKNNNLVQNEQWKKLADNLIVYAEEIKCTVINQALYGAVCEDIETYKKLIQTL